MRTRLFMAASVAILVGIPAASHAQGVVVDQGQFAVRRDGVEVGTEDFVIRRAGVGRDDAVFANGTVVLRRNGARQEVRPLLRAAPPAGVAESYQVSVAGIDAMEVRLARAGRRYVATIRSAVGDEDREFQAQADTRVLELDVAHHYYFVRDVRADRPFHVIEPRTRRQMTLTAGAPSEQDLRIGANVVTSRLVEFTSDQGDVRRVWFDRQGRVLRVEIPSLRYEAQRTDLVG